MIHPTAIVDPQARLDPSVQVGPFAVIDANVVLGPGCIVGPHVYITGLTVIGKRNRFFAGSVIGEAPQDLKYQGEPTPVRIGDDNTFRENTSVHRSSRSDEQTVIGSHNLHMVGAHVAHNCRLGDHVILANGALLGGYVTVEDRAFISGNTVVHQFTRVGSLAMLQGGSAFSKDIPPYTVGSGRNGICGLNLVGLRRAGFTAEDRLELKQLYRAIFREGNNLRTAVAQARERFKRPPSLTMLDFIAASERGVCPHVRQRVGAQPLAEA